MALIGTLVEKLLPKGSITLITPGKSPSTYGRGGGKHLTVRFTDRKVAFDIMRNPRLGFGEAYMDGRLIIEDGTILDLVEMITGANRWEHGGAGRKALRKGKFNLLRLFRRNTAVRSKRNVAHHYDLKDDLYEAFLDDDRQYSCAYFTDPGNSLEQAQSDKKAHIAAKLALEPGQHVLDIGCGDGALLDHLQRERGCSGYGIEIADENVLACVKRGVNVIQANLDQGLAIFDDDTFDVVLQIDTLQNLRNAETMLRETARVGKVGIVAFPNFAHWPNRLSIVRGRMPVTKRLPYQWYDTPNIRVGTFKDFEVASPRRTA